MALADENDDIDWTVSVDSTVVRAQQQAVGAAKEGGTHRRTGRPRARTLPRLAATAPPY
jgi:hypothetical protein